MARLVRWVNDQDLISSKRSLMETLTPHEPERPERFTMVYLSLLVYFPVVGIPYGERFHNPFQRHSHGASPEDRMGWVLCSDRSRNFGF